MGNVKNQFDIVSESFKELRNIVMNTPCSIEAEVAVHNLADELMKLGIDVDTNPIEE